MPTIYPGTVDTYTRPTGSDALNGAILHSAHHDNAYDAIEAIETELGTNPKGTYPSVKARLDNVTSVGLAYAMSARAFNP